MVMFYMSAIIDLLQIETKQKCLAMQYRRHPNWGDVTICAPGRAHSLGGESPLLLLQDCMECS